MTALKPAREPLNHARPEQSPEVYRQFLKRKDVFPHVRKDYIERTVAAGRCVYESGVIITYQQYRRTVRVGSVTIPPRSIMLHQILNTRQGNGAGHEVFIRFCNEVVRPRGGDLYLSVRAANKVARRFYERNGMKEVGTVVWNEQGRPLQGVIYFKNTSDNQNDSYVPRVDPELY